MDAFFRASRISKQYTNHLALDDVSITVPRQSIFGLLGPNGAGKTTLIRIINQIIAPDSGEVMLNGKPMTPADVRNIGYLPEERGLYKKMKVGEQAIYLAQLKGMKAYQAKKELRVWFEKFGLMTWWDKKVEELSKGMAQKIQFIVTVLHRPGLLIFDEPFSGFDPVNVNLLKQEILKLRNNGATIIFSTHNMGSVEELCDEIALINQSRLILEGNVGKIRKEYAGQLFQVEMERLSGPIESVIGNRFELISSGERDGIHKAKIRMQNGSSGNELLQQLIPNAHIISFNELTPSMNDIFIKLVTGSFPTNEDDSSNNFTE